MRTLGLEFGPDLLRAVVGDYRRGRLQVYEAATLPCQDDSPDSITSAVRTFIGQHGRGIGQVVIGLPLQSCSVKFVEFPPTSEENLARLAQVEAQSHLPLPAEQVEYSHTVIDAGEGERPARVAIASGRKEVIAAILRPLTAAGLEPQVIDVNTLALANVFAASIRDRGVPTALVAVEADGAELALLDGAGRLQQVHGVGGDDETLVEEVGRACQAFAGSHGSPVEAVVVVGSRAGAVGSDLEAALGVQVEVGDPWAGCQGQAGLGEHAATFAVATGLAMRGGDVPLEVNLRPRATVEAATARRQTSVVTAVIAFLIVVMLAAAGLFTVSYRARRFMRQEALDKVAALERELRDVGGEDPAYLDALATKAAAVRADSAWLDLLRDLSLLPGGVSLQELSCDRTRPVTLRGQAYSNAAIAQTLDYLNGLGRFERVRLEYADAQRIGDEIVYKFQITCVWPSSARGRGERG